MEQKISNYLLEKHVDVALCERIFKLSDSEKTLLVTLLEELNPSANSLKNYFQLIDQSCLRDGRKFEEILSSAEVAQILCNEKLSKKEKQKNLREYLEKIRFPEVNKISEKLESLGLQILEKTGVRLKLPENLEGDALEVESRFRNPNEILAYSEKLRKLSELSETKELFSVLLGKDGINE